METDGGGAVSHFEVMVLFLSRPLVALGPLAIVRRDSWLITFNFKRGGVKAST